MFANAQKWLLPALLLISLLCSALAVDLSYTDITIVDDETRYIALHPDAELVAFDKVHHVKGNYIFTAGVRITGDRLVLNFLDETQFTRAEDIEVTLKYPRSGQSNGLTISRVEIYTDQSSDKADVFFVNGGIDRSFAEILLTCNQTQHYTYEIFIYVY